MARPKKDAATDSPVSEDQRLSVAIKALEKTFGAGVVSTHGSNTPQLTRISTGSLGLDMITGGGLPLGRIVELIGMESSGKSTVALQVVANAQRQGLTCLYVDMEHALDVHYATALGVNVDAMLVSQPDSAEQALQIVDTLLQSGTVKVVIVDSVAALVPQAELEGDIGDAKIGAQSRLMSQSLRRLSPLTHNQEALLVFINQIRMKIGGYGNPETTSGGNALKFYASLRIDLRRTGALAEGDDKTGITTRAKVIKSKVCAPFATAEFPIRFGVGIDTGMELVTLGEERGVIQKNGSWFAYDGRNLGQGARKTADAIIEQGLTEEIRNRILGA